MKKTAKKVSRATGKSAEKTSRHPAKSARKKISTKASGLFQRLKKCVNEKIAPYIQMDGGDIELVELTKDNILKVRLHGACMGCAMAGYTLQYGVQNTINEEFPKEDVRVLLVE